MIESPTRQIFIFLLGAFREIVLGFGKGCSALVSLEDGGKCLFGNGCEDLFSEKQVAAVKHYTDKVINEVKNGTKSSSYKALRKLGVRKGETNDDLFILPNHADNHLSEEESAEKIADYFSSISQEFEPLDFDKLSPSIKKSLEAAKDAPDIPKLEAFDVYQKILKAKKPNSVIVGDVPKKILKLFRGGVQGFQKFVDSTVFWCLHLHFYKKIKV